MQTENPLVSIIMPVYNGEKFVVQAIDSILAQTYTNLEFLIINDGSTDNTDSIIRMYKDVRIKYISRENVGLAKTLIELVKMSNGSLIARMDADDVSHIDRIKMQVSNFTSNQKLVLAGTNVDYIDEKDFYLGSSITVGSNRAIRNRMRYGNIFFHPTVMFSRDVYDKCGGYSEQYSKYIEDYLIWIKMLRCGEVKILPESLLKYRIHENAISSNVPFGLENVISKISLNNGEYEGLDIDYQLLINANILKKTQSRKNGYRINKSIRRLIAKVLEFKCVFLEQLKGN
ncbi:glycosyltransferase [Shewanella baltica]|uniref:glycosyltransferase n=1 Tax=Shewanella baltica TaxID=62322 RepID=UPI00217F1E81|nr:glycosyltransferase [Shewanella baltica]MCS6136733.1 glycosyltransferase [Shewanella baltica]